MKFNHYQFLLENVFKDQAEDGSPLPKFDEILPDKLPPLVLAYVGDAFFSLFVRTKLLAFEQNQVRILHSLGAKMVSAGYQAAALKSIEGMLSNAERELVRRGRNTKSSPTKNASVHDYRYSTGLETLLGYLFLSGHEERLDEVSTALFQFISREMTNKDKNCGDK
ncbi:Hypothetical protein LUCI_3782 [Lucifera butyrica]|uniref:Mini-ribonuclease 3 n=1 Tax=Lucifera butyrica TaxID=1351585 RepID=A0A498RB92_9FIRM|nr:ribonuclease III domain-containing protein [Lucifera butyrica]VBB08509.1 Hypothetical protein LUCI_3782 [Lucifera butyrica]